MQPPPHTHNYTHAHTLTEWFGWRNCQTGLFSLAQCIIQTTDIHLHQHAPSLYFIKLHYWYMKSCDTARGDCVLWRYLVHTSGCVTLTCLLEREAHQTTIYTFRPLSCLPVVHACISRIGVTTVTDWASAFACIHPNEMINTHLTRLVVMLVDV